MTKPATKLGLLLLAAASVAGLYGCGIGTTQAENDRTIRRVADYDERLMTNDLGLLTQTRRPWRGSQYPIK